MQELRKRKAEEEARLKAEEAAKAAQLSFPFQLEDQPKDQPGVPHPERSEGWDTTSIIPTIHAVAETLGEGAPHLVEMWDQPIPATAVAEAPKCCCSTQRNHRKRNRVTLMVRQKQTSYPEPNQHRVE
jgi:hypothetical protein